MPTYSLVAHADFTSTAIRAIEVVASRSNAVQLNLDFRIMGSVNETLWPAWGKVARADGLWRHTCLEAFVGASGQADYIELNFTTSGDWAAYRFTGHRSGMQPIDAQPVGRPGDFTNYEIHLSRAVRLPWLAHAAEWRLGLSAVVEGVEGDKSYWALAHPPGAPDFHDDICFAARLEAPERP